MLALGLTFTMLVLGFNFHEAGLDATKLSMLEARNNLASYN
jgi:hypothetical protein